jgi:predicted O-methyltransferase YrrM
MARNPDHEMLSRPTHDEAARQLYVLGLKHFIGRKLRSANRRVFEQKAAPEFKRAHGHAPKTRAEVGKAMQRQPAYLMYSALARTAQEMMWDAVGESIHRHRPRLEQTFERLSRAPRRKGSLHLDPKFKIPEGIRQVEIHLQPGGYAQDLGERDVLAGAYYEGGGNLYAMGGGIGLSESKAEVIIRFLKERFPDFTPARILDFACSAGSSTTPWALAFPKAEVHGIDVGPALLRYAHARAEAMGAAVHFHQMDAGATTFPDASFDLVVSHNAMHEMPAKTQAGMFKESFRLLKSGGLAVHQDVPLRYAERDPYGQFDGGWDLKNNNEPYWDAYATNDTEKMFLNAGFPKKAISFVKFPQLDKSITWFVTCARKP